MKEMMRHMLARRNLALLTPSRRGASGFLSHVTLHIARCGSRRAVPQDGRFVFPALPLSTRATSEATQTTMLVSSPWPEGKDGRRPNLEPRFVEEMAGRLGLKFVSDGRGRPAGHLRPRGRVPLHLRRPPLAHLPQPLRRVPEDRLPAHTAHRPTSTSSARWSRRGGSLSGCTCWSRPRSRSRSPATPSPARTSSTPASRATSRQGEPSPEDGKPVGAGRVYINKGDPKAGVRGQYFEGVPQEVWEFWVGGYQPCQKWLKDRRGRTLSNEDIEHYEKIVVALQQTIRLMAEIDAAIPEWPIS